MSQRKRLPTPSGQPSDLPTLVDTPAAFAEMLAALASEPALAVDTESDSLYRYFYKVCLIQISTPSTDYLVDPLRLPDLAHLNDVLADPGVEKVFHAADNDILVLKRDFDFSFANVFDTMVAARILGWRQVSLAALLAEHFGVKLDKRTQLTDWGRRPLTRDQLNYARLDSHYLLSLSELLKKELVARGRWREAQEAFAPLPDLTPIERTFDPEGFWRVKGARGLGPQELSVLRELYLWRDAQARDMDLPPFKVLDDRALVDLSRRQPEQLSELLLSEWQMKRFGPAVLETVMRGRQEPPPQFRARTPNGSARPEPAVSERYDRLRAWRTELAEHRGVDSDVVLTNDVLLAIARAAPSSIDELEALDLLGPWKLAEYGDELLRTVHNNKSAPS